MAIPSVGKSTCNKHMAKIESSAPLLKLGVAVCTPVTPALLGKKGEGHWGFLYSRLALGTVSQSGYGKQGRE